MKIVNDVAFPDADEFMAREMRDGEYQLDHVHLAVSYCKHARVAIDGGAHVGLWSRVLSQCFQHVIAVEPSPDTFEALQHNLLGWMCGNVEARNVALCDEARRVSMSLDRIQATRQNTGGRFVVPGVEIQGVTIDSWHLAILDLLKLDIEGSEWAALAGAKKTLRRCRPVILVEEKNLGQRYYGHAKGAVPRLLLDQNYQLVDRKGCDQIWMPR